MRMSPQCLGSSGANWQAQQWMDKFEQTGDLIGRIDGYSLLTDMPYLTRAETIDWTWTAKKRHWRCWCISKTVARSGGICLRSIH
ncbi:hypothetical protein M431DRAFT_448540 [Trichoderma harzianum CBS 226.95]|uniref:Uncharacterized protein n=1 Tax=Trichoderma harzianum CBS 226.95 TaxID=983964 RepID=A0A2T4AAA1_TRIHA|nr:hypothetical protein M431DRAFT_448540 [Trichoderma harzianum CBS 226.95]PTB54001.1 hypothetical protein M431DRAFT_448540 [Trichoderma harzianum CBS 226.95]